MNPRASLPKLDAPKAVMRAAGSWLAKRDRGLSAEETAAFLEWLRANPEHQVAFAQLESASLAFDQLAELAAPVGVEPDPDAFAPPRRTRAWRLAGWAVAAIAAAAASALLIWQ